MRLCRDLPVFCGNGDFVPRKNTFATAFRPSQAVEPTFYGTHKPILKAALQEIRAKTQFLSGTQDGFRR
jgi:hypothetical protein